MKLDSVVTKAMKLLKDGATFCEITNLLKPGSLKPAASQYGNSGALVKRQALTFSCAELPDFAQGFGGPTWVIEGDGPTYAITIEDGKQDGASFIVSGFRYLE